MNNDKIVKKNFMYNLIYTLFNTALPLLTAPYLSRVIGANGVGIYAYFYAIVHIFCLFAKLGLSNYGTREIAKSKPSVLSNTFSSIYYQQLITSSMAIVIYYLVCFIFLCNDSNFLYALIMGISLLGYLFDIDWLYSGLERFKRISLRNMIVKVISVILIFVLVKRETDLWLYILIMSTSTLLGCLSMWVNVNKLITFKKVSFKEIISHIKPNFVLLIPILATGVYRFMDKIMLGIFSRPMEEIGYYENAEKIIYALCGFISAFGTVMMPRMSSLFKDDSNKNNAIQYISNSIEFMMFMMLPMTFGLLAVSDSLVVVLFGDEFVSCSILLKSLSTTLPLIGWANIIRTHYIIPNSKDKLYIITVTVGALLNCIINCIFIPSIGAVGATIGTIIAELSVPIMQVILLHKDLEFGKLFKKIIPALICSFLMYLVVFSFSALSISGIKLLVIQLVFGMISYLLITFLYFLVFDKEKFFILIHKNNKRINDKI